MMASPPVVLAAWLGAIVYFSLIGAALARWLRPIWAPAASLAPALGWAVFTITGFAVQEQCGFGRTSTAMLAVAALAASVAVLIRLEPRELMTPRLPLWACALAAIVALLPLVALLPKTGDGGILIGTTAFDHSKIAIVDEITRLGLPVGNPFFGALGARSTLSYYYLWHFSAAQVSILGGISGWEADAAMTGFTAYASLMLMMGLASRVELSGRGRSGAAVLWVALLSLTGSLRPLLDVVLGSGIVDRLLTDYRGLAGWMVQASWVPQHLASADSVVIAVLLLADLGTRRRIATVALLGAVAATAFGSSAWIGGITFAAATGVTGVVMLVRMQQAQRLRFVADAGIAVGIAVVLAWPLLQGQAATLAARQGGSPIDFHPYEVFGRMFPSGLRRTLDLPGYWLVLLPLELPAVYPAGVLAMVQRFRRPVEPYLVNLGSLTVVSFGVAWLFASTIGNNDLGWRAILPGTLILTVFAAAGLGRWMTARAYAAAAGALALFALSLPDRQIVANITGRATENAPDFAASPELWAAVRRYAGPRDRVANNPLFLDDLTDWPVNPSWAMLANRASCYSGWETARAYVDLPAAHDAAINDRFIRVFAGRGSADDVRALAEDYGCKVVAIDVGDGAWVNDPFARSLYYRLAETRADRWRIYVSTFAQHRGG